MQPTAPASLSGVFNGAAPIANDAPAGNAAALAGWLEDEEGEVLGVVGAWLAMAGRSL
jgi:hypothetical protein